MSADNVVFQKSSIIKESLRIGKVTDHRLSLIATEETLRYQDWFIPAGVRGLPHSDGRIKSMNHYSDWLMRPNRLAYL